MLDAYLLALRAVPLSEQTEMTARAALQTLLQTAVAQRGLRGAVVIHEPKRTVHGAPDFRLTLPAGTLGYVETKPIDYDLNTLISHDPQIAKYRRLTSNLLVTDYLRFILVTPDSTAEVSLGSSYDLLTRRNVPAPERIVALEGLLRRFLSTVPQGIGRAQQLAEAFAIRAGVLRDGLVEALTAQARSMQGGRLYGLYDAFRQQVSGDLEINQFADAFAQTLAYGLFLARLDGGNGDLTLANAEARIPASVPLLRELVGFLPELERTEYANIRWVVSEILAVVNGLDLQEVSADLSYRNRTGLPSGLRARSEEEQRLFLRDPFIYFYEDFLARYDQSTRKARGVYYTPPPIVNFIVRAVHDTLKTVFGIEAGLADRRRVTLLDFATGTGTFLVEVLERIFEEIGGAASAKAPMVVREHALRNIFGFEYLVAPYTIAHLKLATYLRDRGHPLQTEDRFQVFLANAVEPVPVQRNYFLPALSNETAAAQAVKERSILVITGNPPYNRKSKNNGPVASARIERYKVAWVLKSDGLEQEIRVDERNLGLLQDDYVKFIAFAQERIDEAGEGIVAVITNHTFLDSITFRGMRQSLMRSFEQIRVIDLHGSVKRPTTLDASGGTDRDENVFDIQQGVAISVFVKKAGISRGVWRADLRGNRQGKYEWAARTAIADVEWNELQPRAPDYFFRQRDHAAAAPYDALLSLDEIFQVSVIGYQTHRDKFAVAITENEMRGRINELIAGNRSDDEVAERYQLSNNRDWNLSDARTSLRRQGDGAVTGIIQTYYRPFDLRWCHFGPELMDYPRAELLAHVMGRDNLQLLVSRQTGEGAWHHVAITDHVAESCAVSNKSREQNHNFPLYRYAQVYDGNSFSNRDLFGDGDDVFSGRERIENLKPAFREWLDGYYGDTHSPEHVIGYIFAILHSTTYRQRYADFLRSGFPRIPFPEVSDDFVRIAELGCTLIAMHLFRSVPPLRVGLFTGQGDNAVSAVRYEPEQQQLFINRTQWFEGVSPEVWAYTVGSYQVLEKYLKDRRRRILILDEIEALENIVKVLAGTVSHVAQIEVAFNEVFSGDA
jgi:hypothetical protein